MRFRKKPVVVEAEQFLPETNRLPFSPDPVVCLDDEGWCVTTIHKQRTAIAAGDWIIREPGTRFYAYPCKPDIFAATYEAVE